MKDAPSGQPSFVSTTNTRRIRRMITGSEGVQAGLAATSIACTRWADTLPASEINLLTAWRFIRTCC